MRSEEGGREETNLDIDNLLLTIPNNLDTTLFLPFIESLELTFLLPVVERPDHDLACAHIVTEI